MKFILTISTLLVMTFYSLAQNCQEQVFQGEGTYYEYSGGGNCSLPYDMNDFYTGALNHTQYKNAELCGACVEISGNKGKINITIVDQCPECKEGDIDLNEKVFDLIDDKINGRVPISWKIIPCSQHNNISFYFKEGSSAYWTAVQVRDALFPIVKLELKISSSFIEIPKEDYNYFLKTDGFGNGPYTFRLTDIRGEILIQENIPLIVQQVIPSKDQFKECFTTHLDLNQKDQLKLKIQNQLYSLEKFDTNSPLNYKLYSMNGNLISKGEVSDTEILIEKSLSGIYILQLNQAEKIEYLKISLN